MPFDSLKLLEDGIDAGDTHTVIFVDVDGVLNIGARDDDGGAPLLFSDVNLHHARRLAQGSSAGHECVQKLLSISEQQLGGEEGTLATLASSSDTNVSSVLAGRLAELIRAAGKNRTVVLASSWRRPAHLQRAQLLEQVLSSHLGEPFVFDARTPMRGDSSARERLQCIGDYLGGLRVLPNGKLRLLVLEDFFISPLKGWSCGGIEVANTEAAERYLLGRLPESVTATAKVVHTYDEWVTSKGLRVQVGVGLTVEHFTKAMDFLADVSCDVGELGQDDVIIKADEIVKADVILKADNSNICGYPEGSLAKKPEMGALVLSDPRAQKRWLECFVASLPWFSATSFWGF